MDGVSLAVAILGILSTVLGFAFQWWWNNEQAKKEAAKKRAEQETAANDGRQQTAQDTQNVNTSIDKQTQAGEDWLAKNPILPKE